MLRFLYISLASIISVAVVIPAQAGLIITPTFDSSISNDPNAAIIENSIYSAINVFETTYSNPITVTILFQEGGGLGESQEGFVYNQNYQTFYNALVAKNANPAAIAGLTANGGNAASNPVNGSSQIAVKSANSRALGLVTNAPLCNPTGAHGSLVCSNVPGGPNAVDGIISLNTNITFPPQGDNGSNYGLVSVAEHEIDEILGLGSNLANCDAPGCTSVTATNPAPQDLFRYTSPGHFATLSVNCGNITAAYFSYSGATDLTDLNTACNGADWGDFVTGSTPQVQDAFGEPGTNPSYGANEIASMTAIGYTLATPEPSTGMLLLASFGLLAFAGKRLSARTR